MLPKYITQINKLPLTLTGKIDKKALLIYPENTSSQVTYIAPTTDKEKLFCDIWSSLLNTTVGINDDVFALGADSLMAIKFKTSAFAKNINIAYADIFKYPKIKDLCNHSYELENTSSYNVAEFEKLLPLLEKNNQNTNLKIHKKTCNNVLLLGTTGFIGMHIIQSFIKHDHGKIYCIVRDKNKELAGNRFINILNFYFGKSLNKYIGKRIIVLNGNILKDNFGLSNKNIEFLDKNVDIVINAAALVKHYGKETDFESVNIGSTNVAISFCKKYNKRLLQVSSLSVSGNDYLSSTEDTEIKNFSESNLYIGQELNNLYIKSKFISEKLILENINNSSLKAQILRLGNITNRKSDGVFQINPNDNAFLNKLIAFIKLGMIPDYLSDLHFEFTPVDLCAKSIILIMQNYEPDLSIFHLYNHNHLSIIDFMSVVNKHFKMNLSIVSQNQFDEKINTLLAQNSNILSGIINDFDDNKKISYKSNIHIVSEHSKLFLGKLRFYWPKIDKNYIINYIKYLKNKNMI